jgi:hypothetical protein
VGSYGQHPTYAAPLSDTATAIEQPQPPSPIKEDPISIGLVVGLTLVLILLVLHWMFEKFDLDDDRDGQNRPFY